MFLTQNSLFHESPRLVWLILYVALLFFIVAPSNNVSILLCVILLLLVLMYMYRYPTLPRESIKHNNMFLSPCDGTVLDVVVHPDTKQVQFAIFLHLFNQHHQYVPLTSIVQSVTHVPGSFHPAYFWDKSQYNERVTTVIQPKKTRHPVTIVQYAGQIARRIVNRLKPHTLVNQGDYMGMIKFSSRVDVFIHQADVQHLLIQKGDKVQAMSTPLFLLR